MRGAPGLHPTSSFSLVTALDGTDGQTVRKRHRRLRYLLRQLRHFFCLFREGAVRVASPSGTNLDKLGRRLDGCEVTRKVEGRYGIFLHHVEHSYITFPRLVDGGQCVLLNSACSLRGRGGRLIESPLGLASALIGEPSRLYRNVHAASSFHAPAVPGPYIGRKWCSATRKHKS